MRTNLRAGKSRLLSSDEVDHYTRVLVALAPQRMSLGVLTERLGLGLGQVRRLCRLAQIDTSLQPLVKRTPTSRLKPIPKPDVAAARRERDEQVLRLVAEGLSDRDISARMSLSRERVGEIRRNSDPHEPTPVPTSPEGERLLAQQLAEYQSRPRCGSCLHCHTTHELIDGHLKPHLYRGKPCPQSWRRPLTD